MFSLDVEVETVGLFDHLQQGGNLAEPVHMTREAVGFQFRSLIGHLGAVPPSQFVSMISFEGFVFKDEFAGRPSR